MTKKQREAEQKKFNDEIERIMRRAQMLRDLKAGKPVGREVNVRSYKVRAYTVSAHVRLIAVKRGTQVAK